MSDQQERSKRRSKLLAVRLDTILLLMTLAAIFVAYFVADKNREAWQQRLSRLETAVGLPRVRDIRNLEVALMKKEQAWSIWVPSGRSLKLRLATAGLDSTKPTIEHERVLKPGRNILKFAKPNGISSAAVMLNSEPIFTREFSRLWNIRATVSGGYDYQVVNGPMQLFESFSNVRLEVDETFDPIKHRSGLRIWLEP